jgi:hypothetical protein
MAPVESNEAVTAHVFKDFNKLLSGTELPKSNTTVEKQLGLYCPFYEEEIQLVH